MQTKVVPQVDMECSREPSFSNAIARKSFRGRKSHFTQAWSRWKAFVIAFQLALLLLETHSAQADEDWASLCPGDCKCTWVGRKKTADCQGAGFNTTPTGLSPELQVLDLSFNSISQLSKNEFGKAGLVKLRRVFLRSCEIEKIDPDGFHNLETLIELDLSGNKLASLHMEAFESNERLRELRLKGNPLTKLLGIQFPLLLHLKLLDLSNCQLSQLDENTFDNLPNLERLDLSGNKFGFISEEGFKRLIQLKSLLLHKNPWKCDCHLKSLRDWIIAQNFYHRITCAEPGRLKNVPWSILQSNNFACKPEIAALQIAGPATKAFIVYADVGSDITLQCFVRADPPPEVKWVRNGRVLVNASWNHQRIYVVHMKGEGERSVNLTILKTDLMDAGEYFCVGYNAGGVAEKMLTLKFKDAPGIGTRVGPSLNGKYLGASCDHSWLWVLNVILSSFVILMTVCFCTLKRLQKTAQAQGLVAI